MNIPNKSRYKELCKTGEHYIPLFLQHWWMEAVCKGKEWDVAIAEENNTILAAMPFLSGKKLGIRYIVQPQLTQYSGPLYFYPQGLSESQRLEFEDKTTQELLQQIEQLRPALFLQNLSPAITNWLPFYWRGYSQTTRYTYRIDDLSDPDKVFAAIDKSRQRKIRRYDSSTTLRFDMSPSDFALMHQNYWQEKGKKDVLDKSFIEGVCHTALQHGNGIIASLHNEEGDILAARFVAFDSHCAYTLMSALDTKRHRSGHSETHLWKIIQYMSGKCKAFDFEGSMDPGIEHFYRSFGARQVPFFKISKCHNPLLRMAIGGW